MDGHEIRKLSDTMPKEARRHSRDAAVQEARERAMNCFAELDRLEDSVSNGTGGSARFAILDRLGEAILDMEEADAYSDDFEEET